MFAVSRSSQRGDRGYVYICMNTILRTYNFFMCMYVYIHTYFMMRHLRSIMRITWLDKVTNKEILERTGLPSMEDLLIRKNLRWTGHLMRMSPDRLPKQVLYFQLSSGRRKRGCPRLRFKDTIKRNLKPTDIKIDSWTSLSQQRDKRRAKVK